MQIGKVALVRTGANFLSGPMHWKARGELQLLRGQLQESKLSFRYTHVYYGHGVDENDA